VKGLAPAVAVGVAVVAGAVVLVATAIVVPPFDGAAERTNVDEAWAEASVDERGGPVEIIPEDESDADGVVDVN
jgi:hypothetical protein